MKEIKEINKSVTDYDKKMFRIVVDGSLGDKVNIQFPVGGIKKLLKATGTLPIPQDKLSGIDFSLLLDGVMECLDGSVTGDFINITEADGTTVRIYVE
ncbi:MAG: hypothetical protein ACLRWH_06490 [Emergencia sp.]